MRMNQYLILLRAVNVGGNNIIKMDLLKQYCADHGWKNVQTYIQSGNILLYASDAPTKVKQEMQALIQKHFNLNIECFVLDKNKLVTLLSENPFKDNIKKNTYLSILDTHPTLEDLQVLADTKLKEEKFQLGNQCLYYFLPEGMANTKLTNALLEKKLKIKATARNLNTMEKLLAMLVD